MAKRFLSIKNYEQYQHYKHRHPTWIKLHLSLLDDPDFLTLPDASKWHYVGLLLLASRHGNDIKPDAKYITNRLGLTEKLDLSKRFLKDHVLASSASKMLLTNSKFGDSEKRRVEKSRDREETEPLARLEEFEVFWEYYPRKVGKKDAHRAWGKAKDRPPLPDILSALAAQKSSEQWTKDHGQFIPHPATWLNQGRWADQLPPKHKSLMEEFIERGRHANGSRGILQGLADAHFAAVGETVSRSWERDDRTADDSPDPARAVL